MGDPFFRRAMDSFMFLCKELKKEFESRDFVHDFKNLKRNHPKVSFSSVLLLFVFLRVAKVEGGGEMWHIASLSRESLLRSGSELGFNKWDTLPSCHI